MTRILRRAAWRIVRLVAAFVVIWGAGVALERLQAWWNRPGDQLEPALERLDTALEAVRTARQPTGLALKGAWDAHEALQRRPPGVAEVEDLQRRAAMPRLAVPPAR